MKNETMNKNKTARQFFDEHMDYVAKKDIDGMVNAQYHEDAVLITFFDYKETKPPHYVRGHAELKSFFEEYQKILGDIKIKTMTELAETEDTISFQAIFDCNLGEKKVGDGLYLKDGKISRHFGYQY